MKKDFLDKKFQVAKLHKYNCSNEIIAKKLKLTVKQVEICLTEWHKQLQEKRNGNQSRLRAISDFRLEGLSIEEIANRLKISVILVKKELQKLRKIDEGKILRNQNPMSVAERLSYLEGAESDNHWTKLYPIRDEEMKKQFV